MHIINGRAQIIYNYEIAGLLVCMIDHACEYYTIILYKLKAFIGCHYNVKLFIHCTCTYTSGTASPYM